MFFVHSVGKKKMNTDQPKKTEQPEKGALTLMDFQHMKTEERTSRFNKKKKLSEEFCPKKKTSIPTRKSTESVLINVGLIRESEKDGTLHIVRGSKLPIQVPRQANSDSVHKFALEKHANRDQFFCGLEDWTLLYPDQKKVDIIPGTTIPFNVERYKKELAKPYSKIDLYLCKTHEVDRVELDKLKYELVKPLVYDDFDPDDLDQYLTSVFSKPLEPLPTTETELKISYMR